MTAARRRLGLTRRQAGAAAIADAGMIDVGGQLAEQQAARERRFAWLEQTRQQARLERSRRREPIGNVEKSA